MKRLLVLCGLVALLVVPAAQARASGPMLTSSCSICAADGSSATISGIGFNDNTSYIWTSPISSGYVSSTNGLLTFQVGPIVQPGDYYAKVWSTGGRSNPKLVATVYFTAR